MVLASKEEPFIYSSMLSIYETTDQGRKTRSHLLQHIQLGEELSREQLQQRSGLTYDQIRRQTKNLCIEGVLKSRIEGGKRWYQLRNSFIHSARNMDQRAHLNRKLRFRLKGFFCKAFRGCAEMRVKQWHQSSLD